jgi:hypothetical protein
MLTASDLIADGKLLSDRIDAAAPGGTDLAAAIPTATSPGHLAALVIIAGVRQLQEAVPVLLPLLGRDGVAGKAVAWALGQLASPTNGVEAALLEAIASGDLDVRENGYAACAGLAARGVASPGLATAMVARVQAEIERARSGGSGLGEHACRVLAVLGAPTTAELIQQVIDQDRFCDRFELQRLRKAVEDGGRDQESIKAFKGPWSVVFADAVYVAPAPAAPAPPQAKAAPAGKPVAPGAKAAGPAAPPAPAPKATTPTGPANDGGDADDVADGEPGPAGQPQPIDWATFAASPEVKALAPQLQQLAGQLGPLLEQLAMRTIRAPLSDLNGQEFVGLLLQVLPQALPPQHVQMALSPPALSCYKALLTWLIGSGQATHGQELLDGLKMVRSELTNQIRQAGILNGPDYSDPDDRPAPKT